MRFLAGLLLGTGIGLICASLAWDKRCEGHRAQVRERLAATYELRDKLAECRAWHPVKRRK